jgi:hypothetical protein
MYYICVYLQSGWNARLNNRHIEAANLLLKRVADVNSIDNSDD